MGGTGDGRSKVMEIGVFILETLGAVGLPAEQVASALLSFRGAESKDVKQRKRRRRKRQLVMKKKKEEERRREQQRQQQQRSKGNNDLFHRALRFVIEAKSSSPQQVISRILFYLADALGESLDKPSQRDLERAVGAFVEEAHGQRGSRVKLERIRHPMCRAVTGVVLSYQERDDLTLPPHTLNKIRRGMHFDIPVRPFDATVQLLPPPKARKNRRARRLAIADGSATEGEDAEEDAEEEEEEEADKAAAARAESRFRKEIEEQDIMGRMMAHRSRGGGGGGGGGGGCGIGGQRSDYMVPCTPQSFPPTPESRTQLLGDYSEFTENVLWRARDELRGEQQEDDRPRMAIFNPDDAHPKILLSCGGHCVALEQRQSSQQGPGEATGPMPPVCEQAPRIYRSVRAALSFQLGRTTYFEVCPVWAGPEPAGQQVPLQLCVGISTKAMPLRNTVPGCAPKMVGLDSSGVLLYSAQRTRTEGFTYGSVVGVCVRSWISHMRVAFFVDGKPVQCDAHELGLDVCDEDNVEFKGTVSAVTIKDDSGGAPAPYYPSVSIKSTGAKIFGHFSAADVRHPVASEPSFWEHIADFVPDEPLYALDGTRIL